MAPSAPCADHLERERARFAPDRGRPQRHLVGGLGRGGRRGDRELPCEVRGVFELPGLARSLRRIAAVAAVMPLTPARMKLSYLLRGLPGHPLHPPLTDVTI